MITISTVRHDYVILGYDLTPYMDEIYTDEWSDNEDNYNRWEVNQNPEEIQLFSDPMSGCFLYFGYIVSAKKDYDDDDTVKIDITDDGIDRLSEICDRVNDALMETGLITEEVEDRIIKDGVPFELICFTEYR